MSASTINTFIGRTEEMEQIDGLIKKRNTQIVCIEGDGGNGKTRILQEIRERYQAIDTLFVVDIIDFDDQSFHIAENVEEEIVSRLGKGYFKAYLKRWRDYRRMEESGFSRDRLQEERSSVYGEFVEEFNAFAAQKRIVLLLDTVDKLSQDSNILNYIPQLAHDLDNILFVVAGRAPNVGYIYNKSQSSLNGNAHKIDLPPFNTEDQRTYLTQKERSLHFRIEAQSRENLLFLSEGRPIMIDLAAELYARGLDLSWLANDSLDELQALPKQEMEKRKKEFEQQLVIDVVKPSMAIDYLIFTMSHVYPLNVEMVARLQESISVSEANDLFKAAEAKVYVKTLPSNQISLHDEMRRMVVEYAWNEVDPEYYELSRSSKIAAEYLGEQADELQAKVDELQHNAMVAQHQEDSVEQLDVFVDLNSLSRDLWYLEITRLRHLLFAEFVEKEEEELVESFDEFIRLFDKARRVNRLSYQGEILKSIIPDTSMPFEKIRLLEAYRYALSLDQQLTLNMRRADFLMDHGKYSEASEVVHEILNSSTNPHHHAEALLKLGNIEVRQGRTQPALRQFEQAAYQAEKHKLESISGKAELAIGWAHRILGDWGKANDHYYNAMSKIDPDDKEQEALILNNLAFTRSFEDRLGALSLCEEAIHIWTEIGNKRGIAQGCNNMGGLHYQLGNYAEAHRYYDDALSIFEASNVWEWIGVALSWKGITYWAQVEQSAAANTTTKLLNNASDTKLLNNASELMRRALDINVTRDRAMNLDRLGRILKSQHHNDEAWEYLHEAYTTSITMHDTIYEVVTLRDIAGLALSLREFEHQVYSYETLKSKMTDCNRDRRSPERHAYAGLLINMGLIGLYVGDETHGWNNIAEGLYLMTVHGNYANFTFVSFLQKIERIVVDFPENIRRDLGAYLMNYWEDKCLARTYLEATRIFKKLQR